MASRCSKARPVSPPRSPRRAQRFELAALLPSSEVAVADQAGSEIAQRHAFLIAAARDAGLLSGSSIAA